MSIIKTLASTAPKSSVGMYGVALFTAIGAAVSALGSVQSWGNEAQAILQDIITVLQDVQKLMIDLKATSSGLATLSGSFLTVGAGIHFHCAAKQTTGRDPVVMPQLATAAQNINQPPVGRVQPMPLVQQIAYINPQAPIIFMPYKTFAGVIDLSHWQQPSGGGDIDFKKILDANIPIALLKATQGSTNIDPTFANRVPRATAVGMRAGAYHFLTNENVEDQMKNFLAAAREITVHVLDVEANADRTPSIADAEQAVDIIERETGLLPILYMGANGPDGHATGLPSEKLKRCDIMLPAYITSGFPPLPPGWQEWKLWQFTDKAQILGVGSCDLSRFPGTKDDLLTWWDSKKSGALPPRPALVATNAPGTLDV